MPTIANRSPYRVSLKTRPDLAKRFPFSKQAEARAYLETLRSEHPKAVLTWASKTLRIPLNPSPMYGVRRPKYFNERDRRLQEHTDEKNRLLEAAREEDRLQPPEKALEGHLATTRQETARFKASTRTRRIAKAREMALQTIGNELFVIPLFETLLEFLLATAARRSEALALLWTQTFLDAQTAFFPDTKNGRSRTVPLRHLEGFTRDGLFA